jgi:phage tail-like protein
MTDPLIGYRFIVTLDRADAYLPASQAALLPEVAAGEFQEAKGLGAELEVLSYAEGGVNDYVHQLPVRHSWSRLVLQRGVVKDPILWNWYKAGLTHSLGARRDGSVILLTPAGERAAAWDFRGGLAAKWTGPELNAMESAVAVEALEIAHQGLSLAGGILDLGDVVDAVVGFFS